MKGYTDFMFGFFGPSAVATKPIGKTKYMDWDRAEKIIKEAIQKNPDCVITAGLLEDWNNTSAIIYYKRKLIENSLQVLYTQSVWATPIIDIDGEEIECWKYQPNDKFLATHYPNSWDFAERVDMNKF